MELNPTLGLGWLNGWIPLCLHLVVQGSMLLIFPQDVVTRLFDRSRWDSRQRAWTALGKLFSLGCLILLVLTPLKLGTPVFAVGAVLFVLGLASLVHTLIAFRRTPLGQPVTTGLYRISRHPQIVSLFVIFLGMCLMIGSGLALLMLLASRLLQHFSILAEEQACLAQYGDSYRAYMERVPRYFVFF
jgi:protein-S-isoprenylcysteine O-methyltransferase Ste14